MPSLAEIRAKLLQQQQSNTTSSDNAIFPFWNAPEGSTSTIRFLPDSDKENVFFFRDTLGVAPLFYRIINKKINISIRITDLIIKDDKINKQGAMSFISFGNTRILPLIDNINICPPGTIIKFNKKLGSTKLLFRYKLKPRNLNKLNNFQL